jgi:hypothetical protein
MSTDSESELLRRSDQEVKMADIEALATRLDSMPIYDIELYLPILNRLERDLLISPDIARRAGALRKKANRRIDMLKERAKPVPAPNTVIRSELMTKALSVGVQEAQYLLNFTTTTEIPFMLTNKDGSCQAITLADIQERFFDKLIRREAGYIQDAVFNFARRLLAGEDVPMKLEEEGRYYVLRCSFNDFCKAGGIEGANRKAVRDALYEGLLEQIGFYKEIKQQGKSVGMFVEKDYIHRRTWAELSDTSRNLVQEPLISRITFIELQIDAELFRFLNGEKSGGFLLIPQQLNKLIEEAFAHIQESFIDADGARADGMREMLRNANPELARGIRLVLNSTVNNPQEKYRSALLKIIWTWIAGRESRGTKAMIIEWQELAANGLLDLNTKNKLRRIEDMARLYMVLVAIREIGSIRDIGIIEPTRTWNVIQVYPAEKPALAP